MMRTELEPLLTVAAVCEILGVSKPTVYRLIHAGELVPLRVSKSPRFTPADVRTYLERQRRAVAAP
jgi:excisionase family DNA binding protein